MHEWIHCYRLQLCIWGLWTQLRPTSTSPHHFCLFKHIGLDSPEDPCTYLDTSLLAPGNFSFHFWIENPGCRHKSSFQDCCGKSNALGNFWDWHIHPHLVSRNESPGQGRRCSENRTLQTGDSFRLFSTRCTPAPLNIQSFSIFLSSLALRHDMRINSGQLYASKRLAFVSNRNDYRLQKWLSSFSPPCVHTLGWGSCYTMRPCHSSL